MAVGADGTVFVADTWDHKIVKLDKDLKQVKKWGVARARRCRTATMHLFGPREIASRRMATCSSPTRATAASSSTTQDGDFVRQFGSKGRTASAGPAEVQRAGRPRCRARTATSTSPTSGTSASSTSTRICSRRARSRSPTWGSNQVTDRAYLALLPDGRLLVTDPNPCSRRRTARTRKAARSACSTPTGSPPASTTCPSRPEPARRRPDRHRYGRQRRAGVRLDGRCVRKIPLAEIVK